MSSVQMKIKIEQLIQEIEKRRPLYDSTHQNYHNRILKKNLWDEVCEVVFTGSKWKALSEVEKEFWRKEVLKKWNSLRDCFRRELRLQENPPALSGDQKKKRKYYYYDSLLFLTPFSQGNSKPTTEVYLENPVIESVIKLEEMSPAEFDTDAEDEPLTKRNKSDKDMFLETNAESVCFADPNSRLEEISNASYATDNREEIKTKKVDDDEAFLQSLLPTFRELKNEQKFQLRIEVMQTVLDFIRKNKNDT